MNAPATTMATAARAPRRPRRRPREWVVDTWLFLAATIFGLLVIGGRLESSTMPATWLFTADVIAGGLGCAGLWLRRRWPVGLALVLLAFSTFSEVVAGAVVVATLTVAIHRPPRTHDGHLRPEPAGRARLRGDPAGARDPGLAAVLDRRGRPERGRGLGPVHPLPAPARAVPARARRPGRDRAQLRAEQAQQRARDEIARRCTTSSATGCRC